ncbi:MAG: DUF2283 domain-containing protein [candidate division Zixibacteria bacterium]|nr:DUF2283 domain-containing protein [Candidatus Tariuqbacter arcticus]
MKVKYDPESDSIIITFREERIQESDELRPGIIVDFGYDGGVVRIEVLNASTVVKDTREMQFVVGGV